MAKRKPEEKRSLEKQFAHLRHLYGNRLTPPLEGFAYRFTVYLPIQTQGKRVFSEEHLAGLLDLFLGCFRGFSRSTLEGFPPWSGFWLPNGAADPIIDQHILLVVYTLQDPEALVFFRQLKWCLQQKHVAGQQVVLIEQVAVHLVEASEMI